MKWRLTPGKQTMDRGFLLMNTSATHSAVLWAALAVLAGCAHAPVAVAPERVSRAGDVGVSEITATVAPSARLVLGRDETFFMPLPARDNALPVYPPALLARRLPPQSACLQLGIDAEGTIVNVAPIVQVPDCPATGVVDRQFFDAAMTAARQWRFDAAFRCEYPNAQARESGDCSGGREVQQAVSLAYRFVFEQRDGLGSVRVSAGAD